MSYRADKQVIDTHTHRHTDRHTDAGDDNTRRPKLASGKKGITDLIKEYLSKRKTVSWEKQQYNAKIHSTVKCHYNACHYNANASLTRSILGSQTAPTSWHALMTVPEWLSTWAKGVKSSRSDRPQRQWHLFVPIQMEQNKRIPPAGHVNTVDSWLIFDQIHWLFIFDALTMPPFGQYGC